MDASACVRERDDAVATGGRGVMRSWSAACLTVGSSSRSQTVAGPTTNVLVRRRRGDLEAATSCAWALGGGLRSEAMSGPQTAYLPESSVYPPQGRFGCVHPPVGGGRAMLRHYLHGGALDESCRSSMRFQIGGETILALETAHARGATCG